MNMVEIDESEDTCEMEYIWIIHDKEIGKNVSKQKLIYDIVYIHFNYIHFFTVYILRCSFLFKDSYKPLIRAVTGRI
jgi:hypothetical protein